MGKWLAPNIAGNGILWIVGVAIQIGGWFSQSTAIVLLSVAFLWTIGSVYYWIKKRTKATQKLSVNVGKHLVRKIEKQGYFPIDVEFTLRVSSLQIQLATIQLCIADEIIEPVSVSPTIPRVLEAKVESYMVKYEPTYTQVLKGRTAKLTREEELKFLVGQERWKGNKYMAHLLLQLAGEKVESEEFQLDFSSFTVSSS